jgi:hypothetical protein
MNSATAPTHLRDGSLREVASDVLDAYVRNYAGRLRRAAKQPVFRGEGQNAMLALTYAWLAQRHSVAARAADLDAIDVLSRELLERGKTHSHAVDVIGYVWAAGWGTLPLSRPPQPQVEWVLISGSSASAVRGVLGSAWRALFLAAAWPLFGFQHRAKATVELERRLQYLSERAPTLAAADSQVPFYQVAQLAFVLGELADQLDDALVRALTSDLFAYLAPLQNADGSLAEPPAPTGQIGQFALAAAAAVQAEPRDRALAFLLRERVAHERGLLLREIANDPVFELSPWVALALLSLDRPHVRLRPGRGAAAA